MYPYPPSTPPPASPAEPSTPSRRVHPRTSLQSPYSQRFDRTVPKRNTCANEVLSPASTLEHYAIKQPASRRHSTSSLPDRDTIAWGYCQRRACSLKVDAKDANEAAIRLSEAEKLKTDVEGLVSRLEQLRIEDCALWEDVVCFVSFVLFGMLKVSSKMFCDYESEQTISDERVATSDIAACWGHLYTLSHEYSTGHSLGWPQAPPSTPSTPSLPLLDHVSNSASSSPAPATPLPLYSPGLWEGPEVCPRVAGGAEPAIFCEPIIVKENPAAMDASTDSDDELEAELMALLQATPSPSSMKLKGKGTKAPRAKPAKRRTSSGTPKKKTRTVSASAVFAALGLTNSSSFLIPRSESPSHAPANKPAPPPVPVESPNQASSSNPSPARRTSPSPPASPRIPPLTLSSSPATPITRRRRVRTSGAATWAGLDGIVQSTTKKPKSPADSTPYSKDRRSRRRKEQAEELVVIPGCILTSTACAKSVLASPSAKNKSKTRKPRKPRSQHAQTLASPSSSSSPSTTASKDTPVRANKASRHTDANKYFAAKSLQYCSLTSWDDQDFSSSFFTELNNEDMISYLRSAMADAVPELASMMGTQATQQ